MKKNRLHRDFSLLEKYGATHYCGLLRLDLSSKSPHISTYLFSSVSFLFAVEKRQRKKKITKRIIRNDRGNSY